MAKNDTPWPVDVCVSLEKLANLRESAQSARKSKFDELKTIKNEVMEATVAEEPDLAMKKKAEAFDVEEEISALQYKIAWYADQSQRIIKSAAEARKNPELFNTIDTSTKPPAKPKPDQMNLKDVVEGGRGSEKDVETPETAQGVNEHMKAPVSELGLPDTLTAKLIKGGYRTIAAVSKGDDEGYGKLDLSTAEFNKIKTALRQFIKRHNKAQIERDRE